MACVLSPRDPGLRSGSPCGLLAGVWSGRRQSLQGLVQGAGQQYPAVQPGQPGQLQDLRPDADRAQAAAIPPRARLAASASAPSPVESMKLAWSRSAISGRPVAASSKSHSRSRVTVAMSISPATATIATPFAADPDGQCLAHGQPPTRAPPPGPAGPEPTGNVAADRSSADLPARPGPQAGLAGAGGPVRGNAPLGAQQ
jgi:hypothetical protein